MTKGKSLQNILWSNHSVKINNDNYVYMLIKYLHTEQCVWGKSNADQGGGDKLHNREETLQIRC